MSRQSGWFLSQFFPCTREHACGARANCLDVVKWSLFVEQDLIRLRVYPAELSCFVLVFSLFACVTGRGGSRQNFSVCSGTRALGTGKLS